MAAPVQSPLRRWKPFFKAFQSVDAAIEAADPDLSRGEFRSARGNIIERLCDAADDDHAERLCLILDNVMAESLETLRLVPTTPTMLATTNLTESVEALRKHESERVRVLASRVMTGWRASLQDYEAKLTEAMKKLEDIPRPKKIADQQEVPANARTRPAKIPEPWAKKTVEITKMPSAPAAVGIVRGDCRADLCLEEKIEAAKRKFQDGYEEAKEAKRRRRIQIVESPELLKKRQRKMHPILRERSRARCASSTVKKTFSVTRV